MLVQNKYDESLDLFITNHIEQRYAERIMNRDEQYDVTKYILDHKEDIKKNITKMVIYGTHIYTGKLKDFPRSYIFINKDGWVVICDNEMKKVITLYKVDLGCSKELNQLYIKEMVDRILQLDVDAEDAKTTRNNTNEQLRKESETYKNKIKELQQEIKSMENLTTANSLIISNNQVKVNEIEMQMKEKVDALVCNKLF